MEAHLRAARGEAYDLPRFADSMASMITYASRPMSHFPAHRLARLDGRPSVARHTPDRRRSGLHRLRPRPERRRDPQDRARRRPGNCSTHWEGEPDMKDGSAFLNDNAQRIADGMIRDAERLRIAVSTGPSGECLIDAGARVTGSIEAGLRMAEAAMGGLGSISAVMDRTLEKWPFTRRGALLAAGACLPRRAICRLEPVERRLFRDGLRPGAGACPRRAAVCERWPIATLASSAVLVLETAKPPPLAVVEKVANATGLPAGKLTFLYAPTQSLAGTVQIVSRVLEVALHKANDLKFPLENIVDGIAAAPIPAPHPDFLTAMGRTNDAIIYGGLVQLFVQGLGDRGQRTCPEPAEPRLARLRPALRRDLQGVQGRFLRHRPAAVQPGRSHRDGDRDRRYVSRRRTRPARCSNGASADGVRSSLAGNSG